MHTFVRALFSKETLAITTSILNLPKIEGSHGLRSNYPLPLPSSCWPTYPQFVSRAETLRSRSSETKQFNPYLYILKVVINRTLLTGFKWLIFSSFLLFVPINLFNKWYFTLLFFWKFSRSAPSVIGMLLHSFICRFLRICTDNTVLAKYLNIT